MPNLIPLRAPLLRGLGTVVGGGGGPHPQELQGRPGMGSCGRPELSLALVPWEGTVTARTCSQTLVLSWLHVSGLGPTPSPQRGSPSRGQGGWEGKRRCKAIIGEKKGPRLIVPAPHRGLPRRLPLPSAHPGLGETPRLWSVCAKRWEAGAGRWGPCALPRLPT